MVGAMRILLAARLSRLGDASTGIERQDESVRTWAAANDHKIVAVAADTDVSGNTDPFKRPQLGPWLTDPHKIAQYDAIVASHLDRLGRSTIHWTRLLQWAKEHGKQIATIGESAIDFSSPVGNLVGYVLSWIGEQELAAITRRSIDAQKYLREHGYLVGRPPFGFTVVPNGEHTTLAPDPELSPVIHELVSRYLDGATLADLCTWLDTRQVEAPAGGTWNPTSVRQLLRNESLIGRRTDARGRTVLKFEPILDWQTWRRLQSQLDSRARKRGAPSGDTALLTGIAICSICGGPMYRMTAGVKGHHYQYYRCHGTDKAPSTCRNMVRAEILDALVGQWILDVYGNYQVFERTLVAGNDHAAELADNARDISDLTARIDDLSAEDFIARLTALRAERERIQAQPAEPDHVEDRPTGLTIRQVWESLDTAGRRAYLLKTGIKVPAYRGIEKFGVTPVGPDSNTIDPVAIYGTLSELRQLP